MRPIPVALKFLLCCAFFFLAFNRPAKAQTPENKVLIVSPHVGEVIDIEDRNRFGLFTFTDSATYMVARFLQYPDKRIVLEIMKKTGKIEFRPFTQTEFDLTGQLIQAKAAATAAPKPAPGTQALPVTPPTPIISNATPTTSQYSNFNVTDKVYFVILSNGQKMFVTIKEKLADAYVFNMQYSPPITVPADQILYLKAAEKGNDNDYWIPNPHDSRLYFGPTGRGIPKGEGYVQFIFPFFVSANVGITDNFSIGGMTTIAPFSDVSNQVWFFTPKLSFKTSAKTSISTGVLVTKAFGTPFGLAYSAGTYGNSNDHLTAGIGFGFLNEDIGRRPVMMLGGVKRVSNKLGLMTENYFIPITTSDQFGPKTETLAVGLYGLRLIWPRANLDLGAGYLYLPESQSGWTGQRLFSSYVLPVFISYSIRFGNRKQVGKVN